ncbi:CoB--CoM heterodisulfide reductase iron-sulfur subunit B family protein [Desulfonatronospira sp. MSAO_Bac3]|uniref:CoB--CoM heterodisulfide reductase iron-sulfur subunit B family protein n=1 Tax=Desulfonatronospira sp. MSAO_Bac3 TaxID=2293857 RepID=UPI000FF1FF84|nr:CoB--CoM heterodisulfide reductase iron-sulfur subunit B family protein [Desulfonatronospira sp. MSAO_Bac3]RQD75511.1 MAG: disulfide reductase [Desulfonatronospira sp. MSAO_Bac3]
MNTSMRYTLFRCCTSAPHMPQYEQATDMVLQGLGLEMLHVPEFGCCGYPLRNIDQNAWLLASARNLALAESRGAAIVTVCNCCLGTLKHCAWILSQNQELHARINKTLEKEGLHYSGVAKVRHLFEVLDQDFGVEAINGRLQHQLSHLNLALHYGCRILRPSQVLAVDNPVNPSLLDRLVQALGAVSVDWDKKLDCCGAQAMATDPELSEKMSRSKITRAVDFGADAICVACPFCQLNIGRWKEEDNFLPVIAYPQLLAHCLGYPVELAGLKTTV